MADKAFHEYVMNELFFDLENISSRAMFGGWGIYKDGFIFALIADGQLYFKVDNTNRNDYEKYGSKAFIYERPNHKKIEMSYWELPSEVMDDRIKLLEFVERAVAVSQASKK